MLPIDVSALETYIDQYLFELGYELVDFTTETLGHTLLVSVFMDKPRDVVSIKDCQVVNEKLRLVLESDRLELMNFRLIISSPGLDRVVKKPADFERFIGRKIKVLFPPSEGVKKGRSLEGVLDAYADGQVTVVLPTAERLQFQQSEAKSIRLVPELDFAPGKLGDVSPEHDLGLEP